MESSGDPMRVQVSQTTKALLTRFIVEERGTIAVKVRYKLGILPIRIYY
jgi:hypothetical protein